MYNDNLINNNNNGGYMNSRLKIISYIVILLFLIILISLFNIMIIHHYEYKNAFDSIVASEIQGSTALRGRIYDRNNKLLVDNTGIKSIYYKRELGTSYEIDLAHRLSLVLELDYNLVTDSMLKDLYLTSKHDELITEEEFRMLKERKITSSDITRLKRSRISREELDKVDKKTAYIYYLMNNGYSYEDKLIKKNLNDNEYAVIYENIDDYKGIKLKMDFDRKYIYDDTLRGVFGNISKNSIPYELKNYYLDKGYSINDRVGISGLEYYYDDYLKGEKSIYKSIEGKLTEIKKEKQGNDLVLTIDINLQKSLEEIIDNEIKKAKDEPNTEYFNKVFALICNTDGEILAMVARIIIDGNIYDYTSYFVTSSVTVGSVIKGASISVGYKYGVIDIGSVLKDECIKLSGTGTKCSWNRNGLGYLNDIDALKLSSNVYQFKTAMMISGYNYSYNGSFSLKNDVFLKYRSMFNAYGLGISSGIDLPNEALGLKGKNDTSGLLLDFSIGQYDTYTPLQLASYINTIANNGSRVRLFLGKKAKDGSGNILFENKREVLNSIPLDIKYINRIQQGFKSVLSYGGTGFGYIDLKYKGAGKTGTSQSFLDSDKDGIIDKETITSTFAGYAPYDNPEISIVVITPDISHVYGNSYLSSLNRRISNKISKKYFEIYK